MDGKRLRISEYKQLMRAKRGLWYQGGESGELSGEEETLEPSGEMLSSQQSDALKDYLNATQFVGSPNPKKVKLGLVDMGSTKGLVNGRLASSSSDDGGSRRSCSESSE